MNVKNKAFTLAKCASHGVVSNIIQKDAFTLAEVLITLGVIGIVAAMTMPALIQKHRKQIVETRLKKFYTVANQAIQLSEVVNEDKKYWKFDGSGEISYSEQTLTSFYNKYLKDYLKVSKTEYNSSCLNLYFSDGSGVCLKYGGMDWHYCVEAKYLPPKSDNEGKGCFIFGFYPKGTSGLRSKYFYNKGVEPYIADTWDGDETNLYYYKNYAKAIQLNGWKIPDDYPIKF